MLQVGFYELHTIESKTLRRRRSELQSTTGEIRADDNAVRARQIQAHLPRAATDLDNSRVTGNCLIK
jgi:hypothetical protein